MLWVAKPAAWEEGRMDLHKNAGSCPKSRAVLVRRVIEEGWTVKEAAEAQGLSARAAYRWLTRYRHEGIAGLEDRSSRPKRVAGRTPPEVVDRMVVLRRTGITGEEIAAHVGVPRSTTARWLKRAGLGRLRALAAPEPVRRYVHDRPGDLVHLDVKKLGRFGQIGHRITGDRRARSRGIGWEFVHVAVDDASRLAYVEVLADEQGATATAFLERAVGWFAAHGVSIHRLLTDNGSCYRAHPFARRCGELALGHSRTRPYRPRTNGKAERFIQTLLREWAYAFPFDSSAHRAQLLPRYLHFYNHHRAHTSLGRNPPISRLNLNNLVRNYS
jgi:transposase InsO family protein